MANTTVEYSDAYLAETRQPMILTVTVIFVALTTIALILRFISHRIGNVRGHLDDVFIVVGWLFYLAFVGITIGDIKYGGVGLHQVRVEQMDITMLTTWAKSLLVVSFVYIWSVVFPKLSILYLYLALFGISKPSRIVCYATGILVVANAIANTAAGFALCRIERHCFNINDWFRYARVVNIVSDVILLILPIPHIYRLQSSTRLKAGLFFTFLLGSITWSATALIVWSVVEVGMYIIATCLISYLPLLKYLWRKTTGARPTTAEKGSGSDSSNTLEQTCLTRVSSREGRDSSHGSKSKRGSIELMDIPEPVEPRMHNSKNRIMVEREIIIERC
ncbi:hypothetical protein BDV26DRAFT_301162 [Aspergillus bertholletiae]|uniref:Rhodopsin domain-containing protein n=1 Tax=Aspergillus bertholletiae TaxID=1226010 RepID=A0A5N7ATY2_9EURO|nr:hypothetical protein BDV26DRAFT_301162 [Aspergillus bertholletiae]